MPKFRLLPQAKMATFPLSTAYQNLISLTKFWVGGKIFRTFFEKIRQENRKKCLIS